MQSWFCATTPDELRVGYPASLHSRSQTAKEHRWQHAGIECEPEGRDGGHHPEGCVVSPAPDSWHDVQRIVSCDVLGGELAHSRILANYVLDRVVPRAVKPLRTASDECAERDAVQGRHGVEGVCGVVTTATKNYKDDVQAEEHDVRGRKLRGRNRA